MHQLQIVKPAAADAADYVRIYVILPLPANILPPEEIYLPLPP
ncbi:MAG: hypothetical protein ABFC84_09505 [Veillonellales bacterium]